MKRVYQYHILIALFQLTACDSHFRESEVVGDYSPIQYAKNYDTLTLRHNGAYERRVYDLNHHLVLHKHGRWAFKNGNDLIFDAFYMNHDDDLINFPNKAIADTMHLSTILEYHRGKIAFCISALHSKYWYYKLD